MTFLTYPNATKRDYENTHEQPFIVVVPYVILSLLSLFFGYIARDAFVGMGSDLLSQSLFIHPLHLTYIEAEFSISLFFKLLPALGSLFGAGLALYMYHGLSEYTVSLTQGKLGYTIYSFLNGKYFFDVIYNKYIINSTLNFGLTVSKIVDRGLLEKIGPFGLSNAFYSSSRSLTVIDTGIVTQLALFIILGLLILALLLFAPQLGFDASIRLPFVLIAAAIAVIYL